MNRRSIMLRPVPWSADILQNLEARGLIKLFRPTEKILKAPVGQNVVDPLYVSDERYGPHKLIAVGINMDRVRLGVHPDNEEIFLPNLLSETKPCYYVVCLLSEDELRKKDSQGLLAADDFVCVKMLPARRGAEAFTVLAGTVHCEVAAPGEGRVPYIFVTEPRDLPITWIDLEHDVSVEGDGVLP
ncbi:MAG: hypothetical protein ACM3ZO_06705 [Clostridia bacterium]